MCAKLQCRIVYIRLLAASYKAGLVERRCWHYARQQEREAFNEEVPITGWQVDKPITNPWEEVLARYRHQNRCASVPRQAKEALRRQHSILYKAVNKD